MISLGVNMQVMERSPGQIINAVPLAALGGKTVRVGSATLYTSVSPGNSVALTCSAHAQFSEPGATPGQILITLWVLAVKAQHKNIIADDILVINIAFAVSIA